MLTSYSSKRITRLAKYLAKTMLYTAILPVLDVTALLLATGTIQKPTLTLILFLEGGLGLIISVAIALSSGPSAAKVGETLFGTSPWSPGAQKHAEKASLRWMLASAYIITIGIMVSAL